MLIIILNLNKTLHVNMQKILPNVVNMKILINLNSLILNFKIIMIKNVYNVIMVIIVFNK